jgi:predicted nucleic acid-binding protein
LNYFDTSGLVKRYVEEPGSRAVDGLMADGPAATATVAFAEVHAGLSRKRREGKLAPAAYESACRHFDAEWEALVRVALRDEVLRFARDLIRRYPLRAFDAIHLASALTLKRALGEEMTFVASDNRLLNAARTEHLHTVNPEQRA